MELSPFFENMVANIFSRFIACLFALLMVILVNTLELLIIMKSDVSISL